MLWDVFVVVRRGQGETSLKKPALDIAQYALLQPA